MRVTIEAIIQFIETIGEELPLELFVFVGTFIEELIFPVPSLLVLVPAGVAAEIQGYGLAFLAFLAVISAFGRVLGASVVYWLSDKVEDLMLSKGRRLFKYSHEDIERLGSRLSGTKKDWTVLFLFNVAPGVPPVIPIACGFLRVNFVMFATATFFGNLISTAILLYAGYAGLQIVRVLENLEIIWQISLALAGVALVVWILMQYTKARRIKKNKKPSKPQDTSKEH